MTSHEEERKNRIQIIVEALNSHRKPDVKKLTAKYCIAWGAQERTIKSYIKLIEQAGLWVRK